MARAVATAILDFAVTAGQLEAELRPAWERWTDTVIGAIAGQPPPGGPDEGFLATLHSTVATPLPPAARETIP